MKRGICKLCLREKMLQRSHLIPRSFYKILREHGEDPIVMTPHIFTKTSLQVRDHVLCRECEDRFNKHGEAYLGTLISRKNGFPFLDRLKVSLAHREEKSHTEFSGRQIGINTDKLAYFALSVVWRSGAHKWATLGQQKTKVNLGKYAEAFRRFLLGETDFPADVGVIVTACIDYGSQGVIFVPGEVREAKPETQYVFAVLGLEFRIVVGVPASKLESVCCYHSANNVVFARSCHKEAKQGFDFLRKNAKISPNVDRKPKDRA